MFLKQLIPYENLDNNYKYDFLEQRKFFCLNILGWIAGMLFFMCILIMSLMIIKVSSSAATYQNQTTILRTRNIQSYNHPTAIDTIATPVSIAGYKDQQKQLVTQNNSTRQFKAAHTSDSNNKNMRAKTLHDLQQEQLQESQKQQNQHQQYQQYYQQHYRHPQQKLHAITVGENAYLLERNVDVAHAQPIYESWSMKAKRPYPPPSLITATATPAFASVGAVMSVRRARNEIAHEADNESTHHLYERLPKRASTMTPMKSELHDQIPRPPRLTSRQPSVVLRRQFSERPGSIAQRDEQKPKPFHFPQDGPVPEEFRKAKAERAEVNNIEDMLQQLHLGAAANAPPHGVMNSPQMMMMPTGLHIAGSFKNLKSSGIANFFRGKRNKKPIQLSFPIPLPMQIPNPYPLTHFNGMPAQPYQRIAMDQFYPFKPRSPSEINLLAMHQQLQLSRSKDKPKKQKKKSTAYGNNIWMQYSNQRPFYADPYLQNYSQMIAFNVTQKPKHRRVPFKVNLDIFSVLPANKDLKTTPFTLEEAKMGAFPQPLPAGGLRNPVLEIYPVKLFPSSGTLALARQYEPSVYNLMKFPTTSSSAAVAAGDQPPHVPVQIQMGQSSNMKMNYADRDHQLYSMTHSSSSLNHQHSSFVLNEAAIPPVPGSSITTQSIYGSPYNEKSNQIMVHLNVFPKDKSSRTALPSTNPFYSNVSNINRNAIVEDESEDLFEPRNQAKHLNETNSEQQQQQQGQQQQQRYSQQHHDNGVTARSDNIESFVDFDHPIVAADIPEMLPSPSALISNKMDIAEPALYDHFELRNNFNNYKEQTNIDQLASEAQTASLFRFPVEDLIQFQVNDAL